MVERLDWTDIYHDNFGVDFLIDNEEAEEVTWEADFDGVQPPTFTENDAWSNWSDFYGRKPKYIFPFRPRSVRWCHKVGGPVDARLRYCKERVKANSLF
jgi:hypothetical protein